MESAGLEKPALDFTDSVMSKIDELETSSVSSQQALISKPAWVVICSVFLGLLVYAVYLQPESLGWLEGYDGLNKLRDLDLIGTVSISETLIFSAVIFASMFLLQMGMMKLYFNKRLQY